MEKLGLNEIRKMFLEFFESKGHIVHESFSLVPEKDKSLLLINSGMAPLKPYFSGLETPPGKRMTTCQKCIRTGDIENIGYTDRHGTFFEMMDFFFPEIILKNSLWNGDGNLSPNGSNCRKTECGLPCTRMMTKLMLSGVTRSACRKNGL